jgi:pectate lyase-like protein
MLEVSNYAELRKTNLRAGSPPTVAVLGCKEPGDDGFGIFTFVPSPDIHGSGNGGTIIAAEHGGYWRRLFTGPLNAKWFGAKGTGDVPDHDAIQSAVDAADGAPVFLPAGTYLLKKPIVRRAHRATPGAQRMRPGMTLIGAHKDRTVLKSAVSDGALLRWDVDKEDTDSPQLSFTVDSRVENLTITVADPRPADADGISLVAAWSVQLTNVAVIGMTGSGLVCPWRGAHDKDHASDPFQCFGVEIDRCRFAICDGWGIDLRAGQSPAGLAIRHSIVQLNGRGGMRCQNGQFEIVNNLFGENKEGGLILDTTEGDKEAGVAMVAHIARNEFDSNEGVHLRIRNAQSIRVEQNRFLSALKTEKKPGGGKQKRMAPPVHVRIGDPDHREKGCLYGIFTQNYHRSHRHENEDNEHKTEQELKELDLPVVAYKVGPVLEDQCNRFVNNQISDAVNSRKMDNYLYVNREGDEVDPTKDGDYVLHLNSVRRGAGG